MKVAIAGAGAVGRSIARELIRSSHDVMLIERKLDHIEPESVPEAKWVHADACELSRLEDASMESYEVVIAATGDDKANLVLSLLAKPSSVFAELSPASTIPATSGSSTSPGAWTSPSRHRGCSLRSSKRPSRSVTWSN